MRAGVLALQGGYAAHEAALRDVGADPVRVREPKDLVGLDGIVFPGGESSTQLKLIDRFGLWGPLDAFVRAGHPTLSTCAGLILAAKAVDHPAQRSFGWLDVDVSRNAWGRQVHSFSGATDSGRPVLFIRAPRLTRVGPAVEILETCDGEPVMVRQGAVVGAAYHPELTADREIHARLFGARA